MTDILSLVDAEIAQLEQARTLIAGAGKRGPGRPPKGVTVPTAQPKQKRKMSPEGHARLIAAVKARWAKQKKASGQVGFE